MKLAFISDIHGNFEALDAVLEDIRKRNVDELYCIGDLVGYGPDPEAVVKEVIEQNIPTVMGNYDDAVGFEKESCGCAYNAGRETEVGDITLNWSIKNTSCESKAFLRSLPKKLEFESESIRFLLVHGSPLNHLLEYIKPDTDINTLEKVVSATDADVIINGHTHLPMARWVKGKYIFNDGSVGRPKDGDPRACYLIIDVEKGTLKYEFIRVKYPVKKTIEKLSKHLLPMELAVVIALGATFDMGKNRTADKKGFFL